MKALVKTFATAVVGTMTAATVVALLREPIWKIPKKVTKDPWFIATLLDAYFGFLTFYGWVYYKERNATARVGWLLAILLGGNAAMSSYLLLQVKRLPDDAGFEDLLLRKNI